MNETIQWQLVPYFLILSSMIWIYMTYRLVRIEKAIEESEKSNRLRELNATIAKWRSNSDLED